MSKSTEKVTLYFLGQPYECTVTVDKNGNYLCKATNGRFARFSSENFEEAVENFNLHGQKEVELVHDVVYGEVTTFDKEGNVYSVVDPKAKKK